MRVFLCAALLLSGGGIFVQEARSQAVPKAVNVDIKNDQGQTVGTAVLTPAAKGVKITLDIKNLPPGEHSLHIHQFAKCEPPDFKTAGPHFAGGHSHEVWACRQETFPTLRWSLPLTAPPTPL